MSKEEFSSKEVFKFLLPNEFTYNWAKSRKPGWSVKLKTFQLENNGIITRWNVEIFPNGSSKDSQNHMSAFLCLQSASRNNFFARIFARIFNIRFKNSLSFKAKFILGIVAKHGTTVYDKRFLCEGESFDDAVGDHKFINHEKLFQKEGHIPDHKLTISCEISLSKPEPNSSASVPSAATVDYKQLFKTKSNSDLTLIFNDGKTIKVHKEVLVKKCPDFFLSINWNQNNIGKISEYNQKTINELLRFAYHGELEITKKNAVELLNAAKNYKMPNLEKLCSTFLGSQ